MSHFGLVIAAHTGHLHSTFGIARALLARGHRVTYIGGERARVAVELQGFAFEPAPFLRPLSPPLPPLGLGALERIRWQHRASREQLRSLDEAPALAGALAQRLGLDLLIFDPFLLCYRIAFWPAGPPCVALSTKPLLDEDPLVPPYTSGVVPEGTLRGRCAVRLAWSGARLSYRRYRLSTHWNRLITGYAPMAAVQRLAARTGFPLEQEWATRPISFDFALRSVPELVLNARAFDFPRERPLRPGVAYVGPCVDLERREAPFDWSAFELRADLVVCSLGTVRRARDEVGVRFLRRVIDAFVDATDRSLVVAVGDATLARVLAPPRRARHIHVTESIPQLELLRRASAMITHGGSSSIKECILLGVPIVVYPLRSDQPGNAARVVYHGLGLRGSVERDDAAAIARNVEYVMKAPSVRRRLEDMREAMIAEEGVVVDVLERHARGS